MSTDKVDDYSYTFKFSMFYILGIGPNWVFASALLQQVPYLENHVPEGLDIAAYMNVANSSSLLSVIAYGMYTKYKGPIPHSISVPFILNLSCFVAFLAVGIYDVNAGGVSICLYLCNYFAGSVGSLSSVSMNPFMTR